MKKLTTPLTVTAAGLALSAALALGPMTASAQQVFMGNVPSPNPTTTPTVGSSTNASATASTTMTSSSTASPAAPSTFVPATVSNGSNSNTFLIVPRTFQTSNNTSVVPAITGVTMPTDPGLPATGTNPVGLELLFAASGLGALGLFLRRRA